MSLTFTGTGGGFTRLGRYGKIAYDMRTYQGTTLPADILSLIAQYVGYPAPIDGLAAAQAANQTALEGIMTSVAPMAQNTIISMVKDDIPPWAGSLTSALQEWIIQMRSQSKTVQSCTVAASVAAGTNNGNGGVVVSTKRGDGLVQELTFNEVAPIYCTLDNQSGGATLNQEQFTYTAAVAQSDVWAANYPIGAGTSTSITSVDASQDNSAGNVTTNGDMEDWTVANNPDHWHIYAGVAGTDILKSVSEFYDGAASLEFVGGGTAPSIGQQFNSTTLGTAYSLLPDTSYAVGYWIKADVVPAAGVITVELVSGVDIGSLSVSSDDQSVNNTTTVTLSGITTGWVFHSIVFRTPKVLAATYVLRFRTSTGISGGSNIFLDRIGMTPLTALYSGGPGIAIFSGNVPWILNDVQTLTATNNYGGATNLGTFQWLFERLFDMRSKNLLLPSAGSPNIADTLIST